MTDQNLEFLNQFIRLYEDLMAHDGYGDIEVNIRLFKHDIKEVSLRCGREFRYRIPVPESGLGRYQAAAAGAGEYRAGEHAEAGYTGPERRSGKDRRDYSSNRRRKDVPRNFKLERRVLPDRRSGRGRRRDD